MIFWWLFLFFTFLQLAYWLLLFAPLAWYKKSVPAFTGPYPELTILICAYNEAENLAAFLPQICQQRYPGMLRVLVVDDASTDNSREVLKNLQGTYPFLEVLFLSYKKQEAVGKKKPLAAGLQHIDTEWVLLTDADCFPASPRWARTMMEQVGPGTEIVLGYSPYIPQSGWLNRFIRYEAAYTAIQYFSFALKGLPYMGVGRNLLYRVELFHRAGGFKAHEDLLSGDDDLLVNAVARSSNTSFTLQPETFVFSQPKQQWKEYFRQKSRHVSTGARYRPVVLILLMGLSFSHFFHFVCGLFCILQGISTVFVLCTMTLRLIIVWLLSRKLFKKLAIPELWGWVPVFECMMLVYYALLFPFTYLKTNYWK